MQDLLIQILKLSSISLVGGFGILALLTEYKTKDGEITRWGKIALYGVFVTTLITLAVHAFELNSARKKAKKETIEALHLLSRVESVLNQVNRTIHPITNVEVSYEFELKLLIPPLNKYHKRLQECLSDSIADVEKLDIKEGNISMIKQSEMINSLLPEGVSLHGYSFVDGAIKISEVYLKHNSLCFPNLLSELDVRILIENTYLDILLFKNHININDFQGLLNRPRSDLSLIAGGTVNESSELRFSFKYEIGSNNIKIDIKGFNQNLSASEATGEIVAVPDLLNSQIIFHPILLTKKEHHDVYHMRNEIHLKKVTIKFGNSSSYYFEMNKLLTHILQNKDVIFYQTIK